MYEHAIDVPPPEAVAIGKSGDQFRTAAHKEYPPLLGKALAYSMGDAILHGLRRRGFSAAKPVSNSAEEWLKEVVAASAVIRSDSTFLPDFQG